MRTPRTRDARWKHPLWQVVAVAVVGLALGWKLENCRYVRDPQPAIMQGGLP